MVYQVLLRKDVDVPHKEKEAIWQVLFHVRPSSNAVWEVKDDATIRHVSVAYENED